MKRILLLIMTLCLLAGCAAPAPLSRTVFLMDTWVTLTLYDTTDSALMEEVLAAVAGWEDLWSRTREDSEIAAVNRAQGQPTAVSSETYALLEEALDWCEKTHGALDITIGPVSSLWDFTHADAVPPDVQDIRAGLAWVDYRKVVLESGQVTLPAGAALDLGGVAKGAAADRLVAFLREKGVTSALLNLGGNVYALGSQPGGEAWRVGVQDPLDSQRLLLVAQVRDMSVVTSGIYQRCFTYEDTLYHHVLDPVTGYPVDNDLASVTIFSPRSLDGDALSTACMVLGETAGMELVESLPGVEAVFARRDGTVAYSSGMGTAIAYTEE